MEAAPTTSSRSSLASYHARLCVATGHRREDALPYGTRLCTTAAPSPAHRRDTLVSMVAASARAYYSSSQRPRTPISHSLLTPPRSSHFAQPISAPVARRRRRTRAPQGGGRRARAPQGGVATSMHVRWREAVTLESHLVELCSLSMAWVGRSSRGTRLRQERKLARAER